LGPHDVLVKISAAALNHRDHFSRQNLYPNVRFGVPLCCDGSGTVVALGSGAARSWLGKRVMLNPGLGWHVHPEGPESEDGYLTLGNSPAGKGTLQEYVVMNEGDVFLTPEHLSDVEAAAFPAAALTAWRAVVVKSGNAVPGRNFLITGIGGGVALFAAQFALAAGCAVYATSSSADKVARATQLGLIRAGVLYTQDDWDAKLLARLPPERRYFDAILDSAGGDIASRAARLLRKGGSLVTVGMTLAPSLSFPMKALLNQVKLISSGMGSRVDFGDMLDCTRVNKIRPVVSKVVHGIEDLKAVDQVIREMGRGGATTFGKIVIEIGEREEQSKL
jgi:NADPH:quinone reductase-like Zn-dependent oxidoreductase